MAWNPQQPVSDASDRDLDFWGKKISGELKSDPDGRFAANNQRKLDEIRDEVTRRRGAAQEQRQQSTKALAKAQSTSLGGLIQDAQKVTMQLAELSQNFHLVSPASSVDFLPEGFGVSTSFVQVNVAKDAADTYEVGDKVGLSMDTLKRIAAAAGLEWHTGASGRLDDGSDPHYCHYRAVGRVKNFDGSWRVVTGEVEMDLRDGSPQVEEIREKARARARKTGKSNDDGDSQIREIRKFLLRHAESKAKNRAIADMGVRRAYRKEELAKPFAIARLVWTGHSDDPELRRIFAEKMADSALNAQHTLYGTTTGGAAPQLPRKEPAVPQFQGHAPPPLGAIPTHGDWVEDTPVSSSYEEEGAAQ